MTASVHQLKYVDRDKGYRFVERDPDLEFICNAISASEQSCYQISQDIAKATGGAFALGYERSWVKK